MQRIDATNFRFGSCDADGGILIKVRNWGELCGSFSGIYNPKFSRACF